MFLPQYMTATYDQIVLLDDLNVGTEDNRIKDFCNSYGLQSLSKKQHDIKILRVSDILIW